MNRGTRHRTQVLVAALGAATLAVISIWLHLSHRMDRVWNLTGGPTRGAAGAGPVVIQVQGADPRRLWPTGHTEQPVSAASGGVLPLPGGQGALAIPPDALVRDVSLRAVGLVDDDQGRFVVDLQPDGLSFRRPARLELAIPAGLAPDEAEVVVFDPRGRTWVREANQAVAPDGEHIVALITHLSMRRVRIRPGMAFPFDPRRARGVLFLESDFTNTFEKLIDGRWQLVERKSATLRELAQGGRRARGRLIASGRLRAIVPGPDAGEPLSDALRQVVLPADAPAARTGWVRITRLEATGARTDFSTIARVLRASAPPAGADVPVVRVSRAVLDALGLAWDAEFGLLPQNPELTMVRLDSGGEQPTRFVPILLEPWTPASPIDR